jgi:putative tryptophan/tyrosine transport system substrate-binding protein
MARGQNFAHLPALAAELVAVKVDVIVAIAGTIAALAAQQATGTIPIVFVAVGDPVTSGLVSNLARPDGNITGLSAFTPELVGKWLEILKQAIPGVSRVAFLRQSGGMGEHTDQLVLTEAANAARTLGVQLQLVEVRGPADLNQAFAEIIGARGGSNSLVGPNVCRRANPARSLRG